ncbi:MAG: tetratricopeptide repeat-containing protein [Bacteroidota bacterium]
MPDKKKCFVIMGYGKKPSYANGRQRQLDLDETFTYLIKPVFDALDIECYRAIDRNLSGSIDKLMLEEIKEADIALADLSTLNANVMWELGVRHALKPHYTIMICEKEQMKSIPFDVSSFVVHQYAHSEEGIPHSEVERFRKELTRVVQGVLSQNPPGTDSPVHTFLPSLTQTLAKKEEKNENKQEVSFNSLMKAAEEAKDQKHYQKALALLAEAKIHAVNNMTLRDNLSLIISRQALCTYKADPTNAEAYKKAKNMLKELQPDVSQDTEVLGLSGAIDKRLFELTDNSEYLESAATYYEKGFQLKQDYYNGINAAFMLYKKASLNKISGQEWEDVKLKADYIRNCVLDIALKLEAQDNFEKKDDAVWVLYTLAEAYHYKGRADKRNEYEKKAKTLVTKNNNQFAEDAYLEQKSRIESIHLDFK